MARKSTRERRAARIRRAMEIVDRLTGLTGEADSSWVTRRSDYNPKEVPGMWLTTPFSRNGRGDSALAESNYRVIGADLERVSSFGTDYRVDLWPGGSMHTITVRSDDAPALRKVQEWVDALADYPVADESDFSDEEWSQNHPTDSECYSEDEDCSCDYNQGRAKFVYVYGCARDDGFGYAIGAQYRSGRTDGSVALFREEVHAEWFGRDLASELGCPLQVMPSVENGG